MAASNNRIIPSEELTQDAVPSGRVDWSKVVAFASSFDPKSEGIERINISGVSDVTDSSSVVELRMALYSEWRRWNHIGEEPDASTLNESVAVLSWIRGKIPQP